MIYQSDSSVFIFQIYHIIILDCVKGQIRVKDQIVLEIKFVLKTKLASEILSFD